MFTYYKKLIVLIASIGLSQPLIGQIVSKTIEKEIPIAKNGTFNIDNKYGTVEIIGWDHKELEIIMNVKVFDKNEDEALNLLERIQPEIKIVGDFIYVTTKVLEKNSNAFSRYFSKTNPLKLNKNNVQIDFTIKIPKTIATNVTNKFGDVIIDGFDGKLITNLQHGDMWINSDISNSTVNLKFGKLKAKTISTANLELKNAELDLESTENLSLISSGSIIKIDEVFQLNMNANKDDIRISNIDNIEGEIKFSTIKIEHLINRVDVNLKVTDFSIDQIKNPSASVTIDQESSDITINITGTSIKFNAHLTEGVLRIPKTFTNVKSDMLDKGKKIREITAAFGDNPSGKVSVNGYKGNIVIKE